MPVAHSSATFRIAKQHALFVRSGIYSISTRAREARTREKAFAGRLERLPLRSQRK
jgi:hypothetical protein